MFQPHSPASPDPQPVVTVVPDQTGDGLEARGVSAQHEPSSSPPDLQVEEAEPRSDGEDKTGAGGLAVPDQEAALSVLAQDIFSHGPGDGSVVDERTESVPLTLILLLFSKVVVRISSP